MGDSNVTVIEGQVAYTFTSDANLKENLLAVDGGQTLEKIGQMTVGSRNYKGHDPLQLRHYGPVEIREIPIEETMGAMEELIDVGKVVYLTSSGRTDGKR